MIAAVLAAAVLAVAPQSGRANDVLLAAQHLRGDHPNLFHDLSPVTFDATVADLAARADALNDDELLVGLMRIAALPGVRDGHTGIFPLDPANQRVLHAYPIRMYTFSDGVYVVGQADGSDLLRARVVAVSGRPLEDVLAAVRPLVPHDNDSTLTLRATTFLNTPEVLHGLHVAPDAGPLRFTFERDGRRFDQELAPLPVDTYERLIGDLVHPLIPQAINGRIPVYITRRNDRLWTSRLSSGRVFYIGYNEVLGNTYGVSQRLLKAAKTKKVRAVVVDVRNNGGGNNRTYHPLVNAIQRVAKTKRVVVLISRLTFSAAENFITELELVADPVFVGEPSGGSPNLYGDTVQTALPATGLMLRVAHIYWELSRADDARLAIDPDVPVALSSTDFFAGRDPVLDAALSTALAPKLLAARPRFSYDKRRPLALRLGAAQTQGGVVRQPLSFDAGHGRKAGFWTHPAGSGPWPVVLFSPGSDGNARTQLPDADRLAGRGIASLTVAPPAPLVSCRAAADVRAYVELRRRPPPCARPAAEVAWCRHASGRRLRLQLWRGGERDAGRRRSPSARRRHPVRSCTPQRTARGLLQERQVRARVLGRRSVPLRLAVGAGRSSSSRTGCRTRSRPRRTSTPSSRAANGPKDAALVRGGPRAERRGTRRQRGVAPAALSPDRLRSLWRRCFLPSGTCGA